MKKNLNNKMNHNKEIEEELLYIKNTSIETMYINDLNKLRKEIKKNQIIK